MKALYLLVCVVLVMSVFACERNNTYVQEVVGPNTCTQCHDPSNLITAKQTQWAESVHGTGEAYLRGTSASCAGCHSGNGFAKYVAGMGLSPDELDQGDPEPTRQDCRACHQIHETYTIDDFALRKTSAVALYAVDGSTFDGGMGNLCVNCHQPRRVLPTAVNDTISGISSHWGPHHGPQSAMLLGVAGGGVTGTPHGHYGAVANTCVGCHMGDERNHTMEPELSTCQRCHPDARNFDYHGVQTEILALVDQLGAELLNRGLINENGPDGHPTVSKAQQDEAIALWNWLYVAHEDKSNGVHNYAYAKALLEEGLTRLGLTPTPMVAERGSK
jgi:ferredoxin